MVTGAPVSGDTDLQSQVLHELVEMINYRRWIADLALPWLGSDALEVGSGLGDYAAEWAGAGARVTASEADPGRLAHLRARFAGDGRVAVQALHVPVVHTADHSTVVAINVLEHIDDDVAALETFGRLVQPGGHIVLFVPAHPLLYSRFDAAIGHARRYTRRALREAMEAAGLEITALHHVNAPGALAWFVAMRMLRLQPRAGAALRGFDRYVVPAIRALESRVKPPFGQSLFAVGQTLPTPRPRGRLAAR